MDIIPDLSGIFIVKLPVGKYLIDYKTSTLQKIGRSNLPVNFEITNADTTKVEINIDTGIR